MSTCRNCSLEFESYSINLDSNPEAILLEKEILLQYGDLCSQCRNVIYSNQRVMNDLLLLVNLQVMSLIKDGKIGDLIEIEERMDSIRRRILGGEIDESEASVEDSQPTEEAVDGVWESTHQAESNQ